MDEVESEETSIRSPPPSEPRWVDGSEVDSESPPWSLRTEEEEVGGLPRRFSRQGSLLRRRLTKKPKRVDSLDVEAMGIADLHRLHNKTQNRGLSLFEST